MVKTTGKIHSKLGKMLIHSLNFKLVVKTPPELLFWPIYSINFIQLPNQHFCLSSVKITNGMLTCISCETFKYLGKLNWQRETIKPKETPLSSLPLTATFVTAVMLFYFLIFFSVLLFVFPILHDPQTNNE